MIVIQGKSLSHGITGGELYVYKKLNKEIECLPGVSVESEMQRYEEARMDSYKELEELARKGRDSGLQESADLFESHMMIVMDPAFSEVVTNILETERCTAEYAVKHASEEFSQLLLSMDDLFLQDRISDVQDVAERILRNLLGVKEQGIHLDKPVILYADELTPSEAVQINKKYLLGIVTRKGSENSHTAILARILGIPAISGVKSVISNLYEGRYVYMDGEEGRIFIEPDETTLHLINVKLERRKDHRDSLGELKGKEDITLDGKRIRLYCNITSPEEVKEVLACDGQGIGLYRSEFTYLHANTYPTEEELYQEYRRVASTMNGKTVIIRTLDIGADKQVNYFKLKKEENPAMGLRAIRIGLTRKEILKTQIKAIYRASAHGKLALMFPMITSSWEVKACRAICNQVMDELRAENIAFDPEIEVGIMMETPAAVLIAGELAGLVDFFSIGTNDLTQFVLACDRQSSDLDQFYDPYHPAVLRAISLIMWAAHENGIWGGICGELAGDPNMIPKLLQMGVDEFSVAPAKVLEVRNIIRTSRTKY